MPRTLRPARCGQLLLGQRGCAAQLAQQVAERCCALAHCRPPGRRDAVDRGLLPRCRKRSRGHRTPAAVDVVSAAWVCGQRCVGDAGSDAWAVLMGARLHGRHAGSVPGRGHQGTTRQGSQLASPSIQGLRSPRRQATEPPFASLRLPKEIEMSMIHRCRPAVSVVVAVLTFALSAPIAVNAEDQVVTEEQILAAEEQDPALAPAAGHPGTRRAATARWRRAVRPRPSWTRSSASCPSWDDISGYGSVEASRAEVSALLSGELISGQEQALAMAAPPPRRGTRRVAMARWRRVARPPPRSALPSPLRPGMTRAATARSRRVVPRWRWMERSLTVRPTADATAITPIGLRHSRPGRPFMKACREQAS